MVHISYLSMILTMIFLRNIRSIPEKISHFSAKLASFCIIFHLWNINSVCMRSLHLQRKATVALVYLLWDWLDSIKNILKHGLFYHFPAFTNVKKTQYSHVTFNVKSTTWWKFFEKRTYYFQCSKNKFLNTIFQRIFNNK